MRQRCADGEVQARADYLSRIASGRAASPSGGQRQQQQGQSSPSLEGVPEVVAARCGHKALMLHHGNALSTQRLLRRQQVRRRAACRLGLLRPRERERERESWALRLGERTVWISVAADPWSRVPPSQLS